jgi:hypothetical protein
MCCKTVIFDLQKKSSVLNSVAATLDGLVVVVGHVDFGTARNLFVRILGEPIQAFDLDEIV